MKLWSFLFPAADAPWASARVAAPDVDTAAMIVGLRSDAPDPMFAIRTCLGEVDLSAPALVSFIRRDMP